MNGLGQRIQALRTERCVRQADLAARLGTSRSAVAMWESDRREPTLDMLLRIADALQAPLSALLPAAGDLLAPVQTRTVPLLSTDAALPDTAPTISISEPECDFAMRVTADSMAPTLLPGDTVFLRRGIPNADGAIAAVWLNDALCLVRIYRTADRYTLLRDNPACAPIVHTDPQIIGYALSYRRSLHP